MRAFTGVLLAAMMAPVAAVATPADHADSPSILSFAIHRTGREVLLSFAGSQALKGTVQRASAPGTLYVDVEGKPFFDSSSKIIEYAGVHSLRYDLLADAAPKLRVTVRAGADVQWRMASQQKGLDVSIWADESKKVARIALADESSTRPVFESPARKGGRSAAEKKSGSKHAALVAQTPPGTPVETTTFPGGGSVTAQPGSGFVTLDVNNVPLDIVLKALSAQTGSNIVVAPGVTGTVTLRVQNFPLDRTLDLITRLNKLVYQREGNLIVVGPPDQLQSTVDPTVGPVIVGVSHASALDVVAALKAAYPQVAATAQGNSTIVLVGPRSIVDLAQRYISNLDNAAPSAGGAPVVVTLQQAGTRPADIVATVTQLYPRVKAVTQGDNKILLLGDPASVQSAIALIQTLDRPSYGATEIQTFVYEARYAAAADLMRILTAQFPNNLLLVTPGPTPLFVAGATTATGGGANAGTGINNLTNLLVLTGTPDRVAAARSILAQVDVPRQLVYIEARVIDVNLEHTQTLGVNWNFTRGFNILENAPLVGAGAAAGAAGGAGGVGGVGGVGGGIGIFPFAAGPLTRSPLGATVDLLMNDNHNKVLASPNIFAESDRPADIFIGDEIHYVDNVDNGVNGRTFHTALQNVGIELAIMSHVGPNGEITLSLAPNVSVLTQLVPQANGAQLPLISKRSAATTMRMQSGQTVAIGGLIRDDDLTSMAKVPFLGDLPFFGALFRHRQTTHQRSEVVIFIRATVVPVGAGTPTPGANMPVVIPGGILSAPGTSSRAAATASVSLAQAQPDGATIGSGGASGP